MPRRAHPDHPRACSALTTEGHLNAERAKKRLRSSTRRQHWQSGGDAIGASLRII
jgi:hypothetical protein